MNHRTLLTLLLASVIAGPIAAQPNPLLIPPRPPSAAPLLYIRFADPAGMSVTLYQGRAKPKTLQTPFTVGIRPGYVYRIKLSNIPDHPGVTLSPTIDVRGSMCLPPTTSASRHPAPFILSDQDIEKVIDNAVITKIVYLEDPESALPEQSRKGELIQEIQMPFTRDLLVESRYYGRPLFGWRLGGKVIDDAELMAQSIPGTILFPGDTFLPPAGLRPYVPFDCIPFFDPILGPAHPREECLQDGGDTGNRVGIGSDGKLGGLDPSDTAAEFTDSRGRRHVTTSNRVCLCVPRFGALRSEMSLEVSEGSKVPGGLRGAEGGAGIRANVASDKTRQSERPGGIQGRERPSAYFGQEFLAGVQQSIGLTGVDLEIGPFELLGTEAAQQLTQQQRVAMVKQMQRSAWLSSRQGVQSTVQKEGTYAIGQVEGLAGNTQIVTTLELVLTCEDVVPAPPHKPLVFPKWIKERDAQRSEERRVGKEC